MGEVSRQSARQSVKRCLQGLSGGIAELDSLSVDLQAAKHLPEIDAVLLDLLRPAPELHCHPWQMAQAVESGMQCRVDSQDGEGCCCHFSSDAHCSVLIIATGWIRDPPSFFLWSFFFFLLCVVAIHCSSVPLCLASSSVIIAACSACDSSPARSWFHSHSLLCALISPSSEGRGGCVCHAGKRGRLAECEKSLQCCSLMGLVWLLFFSTALPPFLSVPPSFQRHLFAAQMRVFVVAKTPALQT